MQKFTLHKGLVAPMDRDNVDTDAIIPKQFLKSIKKTGFGPNLFDEWRYLDHGEPGQDPKSRKSNPDFVLNLPRYQGASILLARKNFGCGSSREHAPWAIDQFGFRSILAPSYADIFFNNCFKNGLLPIVLSERVIDHLFAQVAGFVGCAHSIQTLDYLGGVGSIHTPITLLVGANDGPLPVAMASIKEAIVGAKLEVIAGAGHLPNIDQPLRFNAAMMRHFFQNPAWSLS